MPFYTLFMIKENQADKPEKPLISLITPGYNEEAIISKNLKVIYNYMERLSSKFDFELLFINDGSKDKTGELADTFARKHPKCRVIHHPVNLQFGTALKTGFVHSKGDYVITYDLDLSYSPDHIEKLIDTIITTHADMVIASPYMKGGKVTKVPYIRKILSKFINRFMRLAAQDKFHTFTGMVRVFDGKFLRSLNLKARDYEINPEIIYKALILRACIVEIPAHLDWSLQRKERRRSINISRILKGIIAGLMSGYIFRPYIFFIAIGSVLLLASIYIISWIFINIYHIYPDIPVVSGYFDDRFSNAVAEVFNKRPHAFFVGGFTFIFAIQFISIGFIALQNKRYFEELFHINTTQLKHHQKFK